MRIAIEIGPRNIGVYEVDMDWIHEGDDGRWYAWAQPCAAPQLKNGWKVASGYEGGGRHVVRGRKSHLIRKLREDAALLESAIAHSS